MNIDELKALHWQKLKKMMEDAGLEYKSKDQAIEELAKLPPAATDTSPPAGANGGENTGDAGGEKPKDDTNDSATDDSAPQGPRFDRSRPYGEISGEIPEAPGARYLQGGHYFNNAGDAVGKA